jgi:beta-lactam-binding protein with PASTA domain
VIATSPPVGDEVHEGESVDIVVSVPGGAVFSCRRRSRISFVREKLEQRGISRLGALRSA